MDYGYQVLRHIIQQVFGNLGPAARITILPIMLGYAVCAFIVFFLSGGQIFEMIEIQAAGGDPGSLFSSDADALAFIGQSFVAFLLCLFFRL